MFRTAAAWLAALCLAASAQAAVVTSTYTALGGKAWQVNLSVQNDGAPPSIGGFTVFFDETLFGSLSLLDSPAGWDSLVAQPDPAIPDAGFLDALALDAANEIGTGQQLGGWMLRLEMLDDGRPGALRFDIVDANFQPLFSGSSVVAFAGTQPVSEPPLPALLLLALAAAAWALRRRAAGVAALSTAALLAACGGASERPARLAETAQTAPTVRALATPSAATAPAVAVEALTLQAQRRISRTLFEYDYQLTVRNTSGEALRGVALQLAAVGAGTSVVDGASAVGNMAAAAQARPADLITIRHDRLLPLQLDALRWQVNLAAPALNGTAAVGAAMANANIAVSDSTGAGVCAEAQVVSNGAGEFTCTVLAGRVAPFIVVATEPFGAYPPMVSIVGTAPLPGRALVANVTPITTAIVAQLAPGFNPLALLNGPNGPLPIDLAALARATANVLTQIAPVLAAVGAPANYDPFTTPIVAANNQQTGNSADLAIEMLRFSVVGGVPVMSTVDNPTATVPVAGPNTINPPVVPTPSAGALSFAQTLRSISENYNACFALSVAQRVLAFDASIPLTGGGPNVTQMAPQCERVAHPAFLHNGYLFGQARYGLLRDNRMVGAVFALPEVMLYLPDATPAGSDRAVVNLRYVDNNGVSGNVIEVMQRLPGSATPQRPSDWWVYGNHDPVDTGVRSYVRRSEQLAPTPGVAPFQGVGPSRFESGLEIYINKDGPGSIGLRAARVTGPGLPLAGLVYTRPDPSIITDQTWLNIRNKTGNTDPAVATFAGNGGNIFVLHRTRGVAGALAGETAPNPNAGNTNNTQFLNNAHPLDYGAPVGTPTLSYIDFGQLKAHNVYTIEVFYNGETAPRHVLSKRTLSPVTPATFAQNLQWIDITPATRNYLDPAHPLAAAQATMALSWTPNPFAETVSSAGVFTFGGGRSIAHPVIGVPRGATSATAVAPVGFLFPALDSTGSTARTIQLRYRMLDGSYKDAVFRFN